MTPPSLSHGLPSSGLSRAPCSLQEPRPGPWVWELGERALISLCMQVEGQAGPAGEGFSAARSQLSLEGPASRQQQREWGLCWLPGLDGQAATVRSGPIQRPRRGHLAQGVGGLDSSGIPNTFGDPQLLVTVPSSLPGWDPWDTGCFWTLSSPKGMGTLEKSRGKLRTEPRVGRGQP